MKPIQFRWIEAFRAVAVTGSTVRAAQLLSVDQSAVSRRVAALETQLGVRLFERVNRRLVLTAAGQVLVQEAETATEALARFRRRAAALRQSTAGHVHIVTSSTLARGLLPPALARFREGFPDTTIEVEVVSRIELEARVGRQDFDLCAIALPFSYPGEHMIGLGVFEGVSVLPRGHRLAGREVVALAALAKERLVGLTPGAIGRSRVEDLFEENGLVYQPAIETTAAALNEMVGVGLGVAISDPFTAQALASESLVVRRLRPTLHYEFALLEPLARPRTALVAALIEAIREHAGVGGR
jgi:DNA-binding transcriptional LysR family regulator